MALVTVATCAIPSTTFAGPGETAYCADAEEAAFLDLVNDYRAENGLEPLGFSRTLSEAAEFHSADMAATGSFDHTMSDGTTVEQNIRNHGYDGGTYGENIVAGTDTADYAFQTWRASATHNENMLRPAFVAIGIGRVQDVGSGYGWYWTTIFGGAFDEPAAVCGEVGSLARTIDDVNLRRGPGPEFDVVQAVPAGVEFPVVGEAVDGYLPVEHESETVWVALEFLAVDGAQPPLTTVETASPEPLMTVTETVTLRSAPAQDAAVVTMIPAGEAVELSGEDVDGFVAATWEGSSGWIDGSYVVGQGETAEPAAASGDDLAGIMVTATDALNLRAEPSRAGAVIAVVPIGSELLLTGDRESGYFEVRLGDLVAWADAAYLQA